MKLTYAGAARGCGCNSDVASGSQVSCGIIGCNSALKSRMYPYGRDQTKVRTIRGDKVPVHDHHPTNRYYTPETSHKRGKRTMKVLPSSRFVLCFWLSLGLFFLSSTQHSRWGAAPNARWCGGQGLPVICVWASNGPLPTGTHRAPQIKQESTSGPVKRRKATAPPHTAAIHEECAE